MGDEVADKLLTPQQVCDRLGIRPKTLYEWVSQKRIEVVKLSARCNRFRESVIQRMIDERTVEAAGE
jgi:excisionase family DNA binding protein